MMYKINPLRTLLIVVALSYTIRALGLRRQLNEAHGQLIQFGSFQFWLNAMISFFLSIFAGICSGLTIGYNSISKTQMELWANSSNEQEKKMGLAILEILKDRHLLLSTLLLSNALSLEALPIFLDKIVPAFLAVFISTTIVLIFGQVIPQAYCTGPNKNSIGYYMIPFIKFLQFIFYPIVKPIAKGLDSLIQHGQNDEGKIVLDHEKMKSVLLLHNKKQYGYRPQEIEILQNCLDLRLVHLNQVMIPLQDVFMFQANTKVDQNFVKSIQDKNYSKIPIYQRSRQNIIGFLKTKNLMQFDITNPKSLREGDVINPPVFINSKQTLLDAIDILKTKKINFAIVTNDVHKSVGIITFKQIFDKIVLKKFKDTEIRAHIQFSKQGRIDNVKQAEEQD